MKKCSIQEHGVGAGTLSVVHLSSKIDVCETGLCNLFTYLSTNYNHFRTICPDLQFCSQVFSFVFSCEDLLSVDHNHNYNPITNFSHTQRDNILLVTFLTSLSLLTQSVHLSILLHIRVRITALVLISSKEPNLAQQRLSVYDETRSRTKVESRAELREWKGEGRRRKEDRQ